MSIELLIMPLSRYWAGDYVTPGMKRAQETWNGLRYKQPARRFSRHDASQPGGAERARQERVLLLERRIPQLIRSFPEAVSGWDEGSNEEPHFFELDQGCYEHVLMDSQDASFDHMPHLLTASIFLPPRFIRTFEREGLQFGSVPVLAAELRKVSWTRDAGPAAVLFEKAAVEATRLSLPLFVDL